MSELTLFLEGSKAIGRVRLSPAEMQVKPLTNKLDSDSIQHASVGGNQGH